MNKLISAGMIKAAKVSASIGVIAGGLYQQVRISELEWLVKVQEQDLARNYKLLCEHVPRYPWHDMPKEGGAFDLLPGGGWVRSEPERTGPDCKDY